MAVPRRLLSCGLYEAWKGRHEMASTMVLWVTSNLTPTSGLCCTMVLPKHHARKTTSGFFYVKGETSSLRLSAQQPNVETLHALVQPSHSYAHFSTKVHQGLFQTIATQFSCLIKLDPRSDIHVKDLSLTF